MIFVNPNSFSIPAARREVMQAATAELVGKAAQERSQFIEDQRHITWGHDDVLNALKAIVGNKCWYSEVRLEGADPNVDHFRPKGQIREVDVHLENTSVTCEGYWWLAFEPLNYRLASMHSNQRRVDKDTAGGKWNYFPIRTERVAAETLWGEIQEDLLALDPCSFSDVRLLWFDPDGKPCPAKWPKREADIRDIERVKTTIWLYHLDKKEIQAQRSGHVQDIQTDIRKANIDYRLWKPDSANPNLQAKNSFDEKIAEIKMKISDKAEFASAKRCAVRAAIVDYSWIEEFNVI